MKVTLEYFDEQVKKLLEALAEKSQEAEDTKLIIGTNVSYAAEHQLGEGQVKREFLGVSEDDQIIVMEILRENLRLQNVSLRVALREIGEYLLLSTDRRWAEEIAPDGTPWKPNAPWVVEWKKRRGRIQKILQSTGRLRSSISYRIE